MAQLSDDCFAFSGPLMPLAEVGRRIGERVAPVPETETVALEAARGRVLVEPLLAPIDLPPFANSAVDGYAVRYDDLATKGETRLRVADRVTAGGVAARALKPAEAVRIFTGAPMPEGADTVFMQEDCRVEDDDVIVPPGLKRGANRRPAGEDVAAGKEALPAGCRLQAAHVALAAALGVAKLRVRRRLRVALFSTGDEIVPPGGPLPPSGIYDANRRLLDALLQHFCASVTDLGILPDDRQRLAPALANAAADHDVILTSGGVSTGEADHVRSAVEAIGRLVFWRVAIKPGRPVAMGVIPTRTGNAAFVGLPGNPVAAFVTFVHVVRPLLLRLSGANPEPLTAFPVRAGFNYRKKQGRREFVRVSLRREPDGALLALKHPRDGAGVITSLTQTDGLAELPEEMSSIEPGASIGFIPYSALLG